MQTRNLQTHHKNRHNEVKTVVFFLKFGKAVGINNVLLLG